LPQSWIRRENCDFETHTFAPVNSVTVLLDASRAATPSATTPVVLADAGVENVNAQVDDLIITGVRRRVLAFTELKFSNLCLMKSPFLLRPLMLRPATDTLLR
jgi:hypothetical protein